MIKVKPRNCLFWILVCIIIVPGAAYTDTSAPQNDPSGAQPATEYTVKQNAQVFGELDFNNQEEYQLANKGYIAPPEDMVIRNQKGEVVWSFSAFDFEKTPPLEKAGDYHVPTVNPSLWRQAQLNNHYGLFKVTENADDQSNIYQVRGYDLANMTIIEGKTGIIVLDTLTSNETARAAVQLYNNARGTAHYGKAPAIKAVIYSHSHIDHFGGVAGIISQRDLKSDSNAQGTEVIAPDGFLDAAVSENIYVGNSMSRRAGYMYGTPLLAVKTPDGKVVRGGGGEKGLVDSGLGKALSTGTSSIIAPTKVIKTSDGTFYSYSVDGVNMEFQLTPNTEAPSEMTVYFPDFKALDMGEIACPLMHNLLTMRGSQVRDALQWAHYLTQSLDRYGDKATVMLGQHNWPRWGRQEIVQVLANQRDLYKYVHDQTLRLTNEGYTLNDLAEMVVLPDSLKKPWYDQGYYGTLRHNVKAVYQKYVGWYDANPAHLNPLSNRAASKKYVEYMGGMDSLIKQAQTDFDKGEYRWVAEVMNHAVFAYPDDQAAADLQAKALEQLGYQAEAATWRNAYIMGANELRNGIATQPGSSEGASIMAAMTLPMYFDYTGIRLNGPKADGKRITIKWEIGCGTEKKSEKAKQLKQGMCGDYVTVLENSALTYLPADEFPRSYAAAWHSPNPVIQKAGLKLTREAFNRLIIALGIYQGTDNAAIKAKLREVLQAAIDRQDIVIEGDIQAIVEFMALLDDFSPDFPIIKPHSAMTTITDRH